MKWFIGPDEVPEALNRNEDLRVGVQQVKALLAAFSNHSVELLQKLKVTGDYKCFGVVVSQNWIGQQSVQDEIVPIVNIDHFIGKATIADRMSDIVQWLAERQYLPVEGVHFTTVKAKVAVAGYDATWYDIKTLIDQVYDPTTQKPPPSD